MGRVCSRRAARAGLAPTLCLHYSLCSYIRKKKGEERRRREGKKRKEKKKGNFSKLVNF
jgi:hypothetical protein